MKRERERGRERLPDAEGEDVGDVAMTSASAGHHERTGSMDTDAVTRARDLELLRTLPPPERLMRALALTALVRDLAWQGATANAGHLGAEAVLRRFLSQLYGAELAVRIAVPGLARGD